MAGRSLSTRICQPLSASVSLCQPDVLSASASHLDLGCAPYVLYGVKYIDLVTLWWSSGLPHIQRISSCFCVPACICWPDVPYLVHTVTPCVHTGAGRDPPQSATLLYPRRRITGDTP